MKHFAVYSRKAIWRESVARAACWANVILMSLIIWSLSVLHLGVRWEWCGGASSGRGKGQLMFKTLVMCSENGRFEIPLLRNYEWNLYYVQMKFYVLEGISMLEWINKFKIAMQCYLCIVHVIKYIKKNKSAIRCYTTSTGSNFINLFLSYFYKTA